MELGEPLRGLPSPYSGLTPEERERRIEQEKRETDVFLDELSRLPRTPPRSLTRRLITGIAGLIDVAAAMVASGALIGAFIFALNGIYRLCVLAWRRYPACVVVAICGLLWLSLRHLAEQARKRKFLATRREESETDLAYKRARRRIEDERQQEQP